MEHTFQHGDRVVCVKSEEHRRCGGAGQYWEYQPTKKWGIKFDDPALNVGDKNFYSFGDIGHGDPSYFMRHDTDFQVGDWVRYVGIVPEKRYGDIANDYIAQPLTVDAMREDGGIVILAHDKPRRAPRICERENLVKIQPPKEGAMDSKCQEYDAIERGIKEKIRILELQVEKAKCCLETYRDLKKFIHQPHEDDHGTR